MLKHILSFTFYPPIIIINVHQEMGLGCNLAWHIIHENF